MLKPKQQEALLNTFPEILDDPNRILPKDDNVEYISKSDGSGIIYLVRARRHVLRGVSVYKLGMSNNFDNKRVKSYNGCEYICSCKFPNIVKTEKKLLKLFSQKFGDPVEGAEYFQGSETLMHKAINDYWSHINLLHCNM